MTPGRRAADVERLSARGRLPPGDVAEEVPCQRLGGRILLGAARHVELAEEHQPLAFAVFHERAVLQAVAAVEDGQEVAPRRLLDQHRGHVAAVAAAPNLRHLDAAPLDRRPAVGLARGVVQSRRQERGRAPPVAEVLQLEPGQQGMVRYALENLPQAVLGDAEAQPLFEDLCGLLEDEDFQPVADAAEVRPRPVHRQAPLPRTRMS